MTTVTTRFAGFPHDAKALSAFALCIDIFIITLKTGEMVQHQPTDVPAFKQWLLRHGVRNVEG